MSKQEQKIELSHVRTRLESLSRKPSAFDQRHMAERVQLARTLCADAYSLYERRKDRLDEAEVWKLSAKLFHQTVKEAYPYSFWEDYRVLELKDAAGLESAITFLEIDPWFFRSGYVKADLLRFICRSPLSLELMVRLEKVVLAAIDFRDRREFRWYCKLAKRVQSPGLRISVEERLGSEDSGIRRRARWTLSAMTQ